MLSWVFWKGIPAAKEPLNELLMAWIAKVDLSVIYYDAEIQMSKSPKVYPGP
jgi:hypothetical protein